MIERVRSLDFFGLLNWIDRTPLLPRIEPYRRRWFEQALDAHDADGRIQHNLVVKGVAKKNNKTTDLTLAGCFCLVANDSPGGNQCYLLANDEGQAADDLSLAKKLIEANPLLAERLTIRQKVIERRDGRGFLMILPAGDIAGSHGKTYRYAGFDEIHGYKTWDIFEAMQLDPTRADAQMFATSYASILHRPGVPLFDLMQQGRLGRDPRMLFSWYAGDFTTDPDFAEATPENRANPSRASWADPDYLDQQRRRLPAHKYRRLHLNLPGLPEGSAYQVEPIMAAIDRGVGRRPPEPGARYALFVDMSGGSVDDACAGVGHVGPTGTIYVDAVINQGPAPPFDPRQAVKRFAQLARQYNVTTVVGDRYAGQTFIADFATEGVVYKPCPMSAAELYEAFEPMLNAGEVRLPDVPLVEQQLLGLVWRGTRIDHPGGEHDDWANAAVGAAVCARLAVAREPAFLL
jgi:hypothetical protein